MVICNYCKTEKELNEFGYFKCDPNSRLTICNDCAKTETGRKKIRRSESVKSWELRNRKYRKEYKKRYNMTNRAKNRETERKYWAARPEQLKAKKRRWRTNPRVKANRRKRYHEKDKYDPYFILRQRHTTRLCEILKKNNVADTSATMKLLGCNLETLKQHIESQFTENLNWNNLSLDHTIPIIAFDISRKEHQKAAFNYKNLRPLSLSENFSKASIDKKMKNIFYDLKNPNIEELLNDYPKLVKFYQKL